MSVQRHKKRGRANPLPAAGVNFIFLENTTSFGSKATAVFNELAKNGATVFASRMERKVKEMGISFKSKIE